MTKNFIFVGYLSWLFLGCQSIETKHPLMYRPVEAKQTTLLERAISKIQAGEMSAALPMLKDAQNEGLVGEEIVVSYYYEGLIYEYSHNADRAIQSFEKAHSYAIPHYKNWQALTAYRLSKAFEHSGKSERARAYFNDAWSMREHLDTITKDLELKSTRAIIAEETGDLKTAETLRTEVASSLLSAKRAAASDLEKVKTWLPQVLLLMGPASRLEVPFYSQVKRAERTQVYLLEACELKVSPWDLMAEARLKELFDQLEQKVNSSGQKKTRPSQVDIEEQRIRVAEQQRRAVAVIDLIDDLHRSAIDQKSLSPEATEHIGQVRTRLVEIAHQNLPGNDSTPEAKMRERPLRTLHPDPNLELEQERKK